MPFAPIETIPREGAGSRVERIQARAAEQEAALRLMFQTLRVLSRVGANVGHDAIREAAEIAYRAAVAAGYTAEES